MSTLPLLQSIATKPFFVVSEVLSGKRQAALTLADKASLQARAERIAQQVANAQVKVEITADGLITLKSDFVMPIALKPVASPLRPCAR